MFLIEFVFFVFDLAISIGNYEKRREKRLAREEKRRSKSKPDPSAPDVPYARDFRTTINRAPKK